MESPVQHQIRDAQARLANAAGSSKRDLSLAYGALGEVYQVYAVYDAAVAAYTDAHVLDPAEFKWPYYLGYLFQTKGDLPNALANYTIALTLRPQDEVTLLRLGEANLRLNHLSEAAKFYSDALSRNQRCIAALDGLGRLALAQHQYGNAVDYLTRALGIDHDAAYLHYPLAMAYRDLGKMEQASAELAKHGPAAPELIDTYVADLQKINTGSADLWLQASQEMAAGHFPEAIAIYRKLVNSNQQDAVARTYLGTALARAGSIDEAICELTQAVHLAPGNTKAQYCLGVVLAGLRRDEEALPHLRISTERDPQFGEAHFQLANVLMRSRRWNEAAMEYAKTLQQDPTNAFASLMGAMAFVRLGRYADARALLERAHASFAANLDITNALARLLAAAPDDSVRDGRRAVTLMQQALAPNGLLDSDQAETVAMALADTGQFDKAATIQRSVIENAETENAGNRLGTLRETLLMYERGQVCRTPWRDDDPIFVPVPQKSDTAMNPRADLPANTKDSKQLNTQEGPSD